MSDNFLDRIPPGVIKGKQNDNPDALYDDGTIKCPWCQAPVEDEDDFRIHVQNQHPEAKLDEDAFRRLSDFKRGKIDVVDI